MTKGVFIATTDPSSGKSLAALGLMNLLSGKIKRVAYFKPILKHVPNQSTSSHIDTITSYFGLTGKKEDMYAFTRDEVMQLRSEGNESKILDVIISKYKKLEEVNDFVIVEGTDFEGDGNTFELDLNVEISKNLGLPAILVINGENRTPEDVLNYLLSSINGFGDKDVRVLATIINKTSAFDVDSLKNLCKKRL